MTTGEGGSGGGGDGGLDPALVVTAEPGVSDRLRGELRTALEDQWRLFLARESPVGGVRELECRIVAATSPIAREVAGGRLRLRIPAETVESVLSMFASFRHGNALVVIPTLLALTHAGAFDATAGPEAAAESLAGFARRAVKGAWRERFGRIWGAFHCLSLQGWVELEGAYEDAAYRLTPDGRETVGLVRGDRAFFRSLAEALPLLSRLHTYLRLHRPEPEVMARYAGLVRASRAGWPLTGSARGGSAAEELRRLLDGLLLAPTLVALTMPVFEQEGLRIGVKRPGLIDCDSPPATVDLTDARIAGVPGAELLRPAIELLEAQGLVRPTARRGAYEVTAEGTRGIRHSSPVGALVGSYARTYARLDEHLFDAGSEMSIAADEHVDRLMNVFGTSRASSGPALRHLCETHLSPVFDRSLLADQPLGLADMGCGDGSALRAMAEYVLRHTERGRLRRRRPLVLLGADFYDGPISRTRSQLSVFDGVDGVETHVVRADVTDPEGYDRVVRGLGLRDETGEPAGLGAFLHTFMYLVHNRRLRIVEPEAARRLIDERVAEPGVRRLVGRVLAEHFALEAPESEIPSILSGRLASFFPNVYVRDGRAVAGFVVAADLVGFLLRWRPFVPHGFVAIEGHVPTGSSARSGPPGLGPPRHPRPHAFRWGIHYLSEQYLLSFQEYLLAIALAGFVPAPGRSFGRVYPEGFPLVDDVSPVDRPRSVGHVLCSGSDVKLKLAN